MRAFSQVRRHKALMCITMCMTSYPNPGSRVLESTRLNFATTREPGVRFGTIRIMGKELEPSAEDLAKLQDAIRAHNTQEIQEILRTIKPWIDGSFGPVNPRMIEVYFKGLAEIAKLYRVYDPIPPKAEEEVQSRREAILREEAERQLAALAARVPAPTDSGAA